MRTIEWREEMNVHDIIQSHLKEIGAEGLANGDEECGCDINDLAPCGEACMECVPAHRCFIRGLSEPGYIAIGSSHLYVRAPRRASNAKITGPGTSPGEAK
jgi:hypothetical protein